MTKYSMKRLLLMTMLCCMLTGLLLLVPVTACKAQSKYCLSYSDYLADAWHPIQHMKFEYRSGNKSLWWGGANYKPITGNTKTDNLLKKKARFLMHNDSLYVNCRGMNVNGDKLGNWYSSAYVYGPDSFLFIALSSKARSGTAGMALLFGVVGGAVAASAYDDDYQCYVLTPTSEDDAMIDPVDDKYMLTLLKGHNELLSEYQTVNEKKKRRSPEIVIPIFRKLGLIKGNSITETGSRD